MSFTLTIQDETSPGKPSLQEVIQFPSEKISVKELIETRVSQEVSTYNKDKSGEFKGLVQPSAAEVLLNGFRVAPGTQIDEQKQINTALSAFKSNGFFIIVNDKQLTKLDEMIFITPNTSVTFLKLVPLVGG